MVGTTAKKLIGQKMDKITDRINVQSSVEAWNGGAPGVVADDAWARALIVVPFYWIKCHNLL